MAHMIKNEMISYKNEKPWHGLGVEVSANATGIEMMVKAKLNWKVGRRYIAMRPTDGKELLTEPLANYRAIVRADNDYVFQVSTDRYEPVQNSEIIDFFREYCEAGHASMETVGGIRNGAIVWALAKLNGGTDVKLGGVDSVRGYMLLATSHDGSLRTIGKPTQVRVVCWNTLAAAINTKNGFQNSTFMMKHTRKWDKGVADEARKVMSMAIEQVQMTNVLSEKLSRVKIDQKGRVEFMKRVMGDTVILKPTDSELIPARGSIKAYQPEQEFSRLGKSILESMIMSPGSELPTAKDTLFGAINGISYWADHQRGRTQDTRLFASWFGDGDRIKRTAMNEAIEMAGIKL